MKKFLKIIGVLFLILFIFLIISLIFQKEPIKFNEKQKKYIGNWKGEKISLIIDENGYMNYEKINGGKFARYFNFSFSKTISGPITEFNNDNFKVNVLFFDSEFKIDKEPIQKGNIWEVVIDGNKLQRIAENYEFEIPKKEDLDVLVNNFFQSVSELQKDKDGKKFYNKISKMWQSQITPEKLKKLIFGLKGFENINFEQRLDKEIIYFKPPFIDKNNLLILSGYHKLPEGNFAFELKYIYEYPNWKIIEFRL